MSHWNKNFGFRKTNAIKPESAVTIIKAKVLNKFIIKMTYQGLK